MRQCNRNRLAKITVVTIISLCLLNPVQAWAEDEELVALSCLKFFGGMVTAYSIHEGGHYLTALATDTKLEWEIGTYNQPIGFTEKADNDTAGFLINSAGFVFQAGSAEILLQVDRINKNDAFVRGMMTWNIINPILYSLDYWLFNYTNKPRGKSYQGDLQGLEFYSSKTSADMLAASITALALFQCYRFIKKQSWAPSWMQGSSGASKLSVEPLSSDGFIMSYKHRF